MLNKTRTLDHEWLLPRPDQFYPVALSSWYGIGCMDADNGCSNVPFRPPKGPPSKVLGEVNPADLFTKHCISRERLMKIVDIFDCRFPGGRASLAPFTRTQSSNEVKVADVCGMSTDPDPILPHNVYSLEQLDSLYPSVDFPEDEIGEDIIDPEDDHMLKEDKKTVVEFLKALGEQGRRRKLD